MSVTGLSSVVELLHGDNYSQWVQKMEYILRGQNLWAHCTGTPLPIAINNLGGAGGGATNFNVVKANNLREERAEKALLLIIINVNDSLQHNFVNLLPRTAHNAWTVL